MYLQWWKGYYRLSNYIRSLLLEFIELKSYDVFFRPRPHYLSFQVNTSFAKPRLLKSQLDEAGKRGETKVQLVESLFVWMRSWVQYRHSKETKN